MSTAEPSSPPHGLPTLTEVVDIEQGLRPEGAVPTTARPAPSPLPIETQIVRQVMVELERQIDVMLEYRLREVLGPLLARAADTLVRDARSELASTLRDVVARAVASELARHRGR